MALKLNGRIVFFNNPGIYLGVQSLQSGNFVKGGLRNRNAGGFERIFSGYPNGNLAPSSFILPDNDGSISSYTRSNETISKLNANLVPARPMTATSSMVITVTNAQLDQIVSAVANGTLTIQKLDAILAGAATLEADGTMNLTSSAASGAIFSVTANSSGLLSVGVSLTALAFMDADAGGATPLSPEGLAFEMLDNQDVETGYSLRESLKLMLSAMAGKLSGAGTSTVTIRNVTDTKDRITATVDTNGNRTSITTDVT